jgi:hypothetical protein
LPVIDSIAPDYDGEVTFLAVAGRAGLDATTGRAAELMPSGSMIWSLDDSIWEAYDVFGQPVTFAITADKVIVDQWFGVRNEGEIRSTLDILASTAN